MRCYRVSSSFFYLHCHLDPVKCIHFIIVSSILESAKATVSFSSIITQTSPCLNKTNKTSPVSLPISEFSYWSYKKGWAHMQQAMFSDRFIQNENEGPKANWKQICGNSNVVPFNSKLCTDRTREKWISNFYAFIKKCMSRKSFGLIGVKCLLSDDFSLSSYNNYLGKECLQGGKTDTLTRLPKLDRMFMNRALPSGLSTSKLLAPEFSHTAPQTFSKPSPSFYNPTASQPHWEPSA